jgi:hypothetical protein
MHKQIESQTGFCGAANEKLANLPDPLIIFQLHKQFFGPL